MDSTNKETATPAMEKAPEPSVEAVPDLKIARETLGISLHDIFLATRVSTINLEAVENLEFNRLPPPVYARDYIRKYARAVGIDAKPLLARYDKYLESMNPPPEETEVRKPWPENGRRYRFLSTLGAVIVAGILVYALFLYSDPSGKTVPPAAPPATAAEPTAPPAAAVETPPSAFEKPAPAAVKRAPIVEARESAASPVQAPVEAASSPLAATGMKHRLVIEASERTWVRITQDGVPRQILLQPGERLERSAADYFLLDVGNASGISVTYQGKPLGSLGKSGEVVHLRLPAEAPPANTP